MLQDHIEDFLANTARPAEGTAAYEAALQEVANDQQDLLRFFEQLSWITSLLEHAEAQARVFSQLVRRSRKKGAPGDEALDWLLVRLMWIWRDVLGQELKIYLRKVRDRANLAIPEPQGCMEFVVFVLRDTDPVRSHQLTALERRLIELKSHVPATLLAVKRRS